MDLIAVQDIPEGELIPPDAHSVGPINARISFVIFVDGECPYSADAYHRLVQNATGLNRFRVIVRHFPMASHRGAVDDAIGAEVASESGKFWSYESALYAVGRRRTPEQILEALGLTKKEIGSRMNDDSKINETIQRDVDLGFKLGIQETPFVIEIVGSRRFVLSDLYIRERFRYRRSPQDLGHVWL